MNNLAYPNESEQYRNARNALLEEEIAVRKHIEAVAAERRALPAGGKVPEDYLFERIGDNDMPQQDRDVAALRPPSHSDPVQLHVTARSAQRRALCAPTCSTRSMGASHVGHTRLLSKAGLTDRYF